MPNALFTNIYFYLQEDADGHEGYNPTVTDLLSHSGGLVAVAGSPSSRCLHYHVPRRSVHTVVPSKIVMRVPVLDIRTVLSCLSMMHELQNTLGYSEICGYKYLRTILKLYDSAKHS